jgi:hypothetical protein
MQGHDPLKDLLPLIPLALLGIASDVWTRRKRRHMTPEQRDQSVVRGRRAGAYLFGGLTVCLLVPLGTAIVKESPLYLVGMCLLLVVIGAAGTIRLWRASQP